MEGVPEVEVVAQLNSVGRLSRPFHTPLNPLHTSLYPSPPCYTPLYLATPLYTPASLTTELITLPRPAPVPGRSLGCLAGE